MELLTPEIREQTLKNGRELYGEQNRDKYIDLTPRSETFSLLG